MNKKRIAAFTLAASMIVLALPGCGKKIDVSQFSTTAAAPAAAPSGAAGGAADAGQAVQDGIFTDV